MDCESLNLNNMEPNKITPNQHQDQEDFLYELAGFNSTTLKPGDTDLSHLTLVQATLRRYHCSEVYCFKIV